MFCMTLHSLSVLTGVIYSLPCVYSAVVKNVKCMTSFDDLSPEIFTHHQLFIYPAPANLIGEQASEITPNVLL